MGIEGRYLREVLSGSGRERRCMCRWFTCERGEAQARWVRRVSERAQRQGLAPTYGVEPFEGEVWECVSSKESFVRCYRVIGRSAAYGGMWKPSLPNQPHPVPVSQTRPSTASHRTAAQSNAYLCSPSGTPAATSACLPSRVISHTSVFARAVAWESVGCGGEEGKRGKRGGHVISVGRQSVCTQRGDGEGKGEVTNLSGGLPCEGL